MCILAGQALGDVAESYVNRGVKGMLIAIDADPVSLAVMAEATQPSHVTTVDKYSEVVRKYQVKQFPIILIVDKAKVIKYIGYESDIDSNLSHTGEEIHQVLESLVQASE